jgi:hypothetical protein
MKRRKLLDPLRRALYRTIHGGRKVLVEHAANHATCSATNFFSFTPA